MKRGGKNDKYLLFWITIFFIREWFLYIVLKKKLSLEIHIIFDVIRIINNNIEITIK